MVEAQNIPSEYLGNDVARANRIARHPWLSGAGFLVCAFLFGVFGGALLLRSFSPYRGEIFRGQSGLLLGVVGIFLLFVALCFFLYGLYVMTRYNERSILYASAPA
jgi:hypothetical protein